MKGAFDAELRARLVGAVRIGPFVECRGDSFSLPISWVVEEGRGNPDLVREMADVLVVVADRICGEIEARRAAVAASQGPEAAAAWMRQQASTVAKVDARNRGIKLMILAGVLLFVVGACVLGLLVSLFSSGLFG